MSGERPTAKTPLERAEADTVAVQVRDRIAWVTFNRPEKRNCLNPKLNRQMLRVLDELEFRADPVSGIDSSGPMAGDDMVRGLRESCPL